MHLLLAVSFLADPYIVLGTYVSPAGASSGDSDQSRSAFSGSVLLLSGDVETLVLSALIKCGLSSEISENILNARDYFLLGANSTT